MFKFRNWTQKNSHVYHCASPLLLTTVYKCVGTEETSWWRGMAPIWSDRRFFLLNSLDCRQPSSAPRLFFCRVMLYAVCLRMSSWSMKSLPKKMSVGWEHIFISELWIKPWFFFFPSHYVVDLLLYFWSLSCCMALLQLSFSLRQMAPHLTLK